MARRQPSFLEVGWRRSGSVTTAMNALRFVVEYGQACDDVGRDLEIAEYAEHVGISRAYGFRRRDAFRKCFPKDDVHDVWAIFRPLLKESNFAQEGSLAQAVYVASLTWNPKPKRGKG